MENKNAEKIERRTEEDGVIFMSIKNDEESKQFTKA